MEAMASGLPCIVSKIRGNTDLIDEEGGYYIDPAREADILIKLERMRKCNTTLFSQHNVEKISDFGFDDVLPIMERIYRMER